MAMTSELSEAAAFLRRHFPEGGRVLCAVSGGLDSMCLLDFLTSQPQLTVTAAHFNHCLRGAAADRDEEFVRSYCQKRAIPFLAGRGDTRALARKEGRSIEEAARLLRYDFLRGAAKEADCDGIFTAHHADDQAETVLLNLLRGTGTAGLGGIPAAENGVYRPFLTLPRQTLADYAAGREIPHVEDETNAQDGAARNILRHQVMPVLRGLNERAAEHIGRAAAIAQRESEALETLARLEADKAEETAQGLAIPCTVLSAAPEALAQRIALVLMHRLAGARQDLTHAHVEALVALARKEQGSLSLPYGIQARRGRYTLYIERLAPPPPERTVEKNETAAFDAWQVRLSETPLPEGMRLFPPRDAALTLSVWRGTDRMTLPGSRGSRSLKRLFCDRGIQPPQRDLLPVLRINGQAAAVPGIGVEAAFAAGEGTPMWVSFRPGEEA